MRGFSVAGLRQKTDDRFLFESEKNGTPPSPESRQNLIGSFCPVTSGLAVFI
ncbi:hypothetical protein [Azospirillum endophyticum]